jgi:tight adherence protein C
MTPALAGLLAAAAAAIGLLAIPLLLDPGPAERLGVRVGGEAPRARRSVLRRLVDTLALKLGPRLMSSFGERYRERLARRLELAGRRGRGGVQDFLGLKAAVVLLVAVLGLLLTLAGTSFWLMLLMVVLAWWAPDILLTREGRLRQERIERDLPDFLDILAVTVRAGLGYRAALRRVAESLGGPLGEEMMTALRQMELGATRRTAFLALRERNASEALSSFVTAQLQAEELGVPLSEALNDIATDMRRIAHQNARRAAQRAAPRVSLIVTTLIVPGAMILILLSIFLGADVEGSGILG